MEAATRWEPTVPGGSFFTEDNVVALHWVLIGNNFVLRYQGEGPALGP